VILSSKLYIAKKEKNIFERKKLFKKKSTTMKVKANNSNREDLK
jgi:hypothetical protein